MKTIASQKNGTSAHGYLQCGITRSGTTVTVTTYTRHGLSVGRSVTILGCDQKEYNGIKTVATVPSSKTFTFETEDTPATPATGLPEVFPNIPVEREFPASVDIRSGRLKVDDALPVPNRRVTSTASLNVSGSVVTPSSSITLHAETHFVRMSVYTNNIRYKIHGDNPTTSSGHQIPAGTTVDLHPAFFDSLKVISESGTANLFFSELILM